ncbi:formyltransferase family protein [Psychrobacter sp. DM4]|uniref:formyltransferase family protein n=1 Tax=Psychrobacter sp. DM4 TaxID=3440637 RepID=UPI003F50B879
MNISFLCSDQFHPVNEYINKWIEQHFSEHHIELVSSKSELSGGDLLFLISCSEIINSEDRSSYKACLVIHASDLPLGRGWSPHIWQILEGKNDITISLLEAEDKVDSGRIWKKLNLKISRHALWNEINEKLFEKEIELIDFAVSNFDSVIPEPQDFNLKPTYYPKRTPADSKIDALKSIASQFDSIRVCDPHRFPAFFEMEGKKYKIILERIND